MTGPGMDAEEYGGYWPDDDEDDRNYWDDEKKHAPPSPRVLTEEEVERLRQERAAAHTGLAHAHEVKILDDDGRVAGA